MDKPFILVLNGPSSVGKSTLARAIQAKATAPFLHMAMDQFLEMVPAPLLDDRSGMKFVQLGTDTDPCLEVVTGPVVDRVLAGMRRAVAAMAECGNNLIIDDVMLGDEEKDYRSLLSPFNLRIVGLSASLELLSQRERRRGDRALGLAKWQWQRVHENREYDLTVDTGNNTAEELAEKICERFSISMA